MDGPGFGEHVNNGLAPFLGQLIMRFFKFLNGLNCYLNVVKASDFTPDAFYNHNPLLADLLPLNRYRYVCTTVIKTKI